MTKKINKFDALAYAVCVLGQPHETGKDRLIEATHGLVADAHTWRMPCGRWLGGDEWSDGDQSTAGGVWGTVGSVGYVARDNDDGSLCPEYEEQARGLIDAYADECKHHG